MVSSSSSFSSFSHHAYTEKSSAELFKSIEPIKVESDHEKELVNLAKLYTNEAKYSDENDSFSFKLTIFHDMCDRVDVSQSAKLKTFLIMLKDLTFDYYYWNMKIDVSITFDEMCFSMKNYFKDVEYKRDILSKWNNLILKFVMIKSENESKSTEECLQLLIKNLRHL